MKNTSRPDAPNPGAWSNAGWIAAALVMLLTAPAAAQESHEAEGEHAHRHELAFFAGGTYEEDDKESFLTLGAEYEFRVHPRLGIGLGVEYLFDVDALLLVFPFTWRLAGELALVGAPGVEIEPRHSATHGGATSAGESGQGGDDSHYLTRIGLQYAIRLGDRYSVVPFVAVDFVDRGPRISKAVVYGGKFAMGF